MFRVKLIFPHDFFSVRLICANHNICKANKNHLRNSKLSFLKKILLCFYVCIWYKIIFIIAANSILCTLIFYNDVPTVKFPMITRGRGLNSKRPGYAYICEI